MGLFTSAWEVNKESSAYNVSGAEGFGETHTTTYLRTEATMDVRYVP